MALPHGTLAWDDVGPHRGSVPVVLLHGFPHDRGLWSGQVSSYATAFPGTRLLVPDLPGFGRSTRLSAATMDGFADAVAALCRTKRRALIATVQQEGVGPLVEGLVASQLGPGTRERDPVQVERVAVMLRRAPASGVIDAAQAIMDRPDSTGTLDTITVPTLVLVGVDDALTPVTDSIAMSSAIRRSRLVTIPDAGHLAPLEQPHVVNAAVAEFLDVAVRDG